jgi:hypothetical protein
MAIHECILASGFVTGALVGGKLSDYFHRLVPYQLSAIVITTGILVQITLFLAYHFKLHRTKIRSTSASNTE